MVSCRYYVYVLFFLTTTHQKLEAGCEKKLIEKIAVLSNMHKALPLKHIFLPQDKKSSHISGWHHDHKHKIVSQGHFNNKKLIVKKRTTYAFKIYELTWKLEHHKQTKTSSFFPSQWSPQKVCTKITEALSYIKQNNVRYIKNNNRALFKHAIGYTQEGIPLKIIRRVKNNALVSFYPSIQHLDHLHDDYA